MTEPVKVYIPNKVVFVMIQSIPGFNLSLYTGFVPIRGVYILIELKNLVREFLQDKATYCSPRTVKDYRQNMDKFLSCSPVQYLEELSPAVIRQYILQLRSSGTRNVTVNSYCRVLKVFCHWLNENRYTDTCLFDKVRLPRSDAGIRKPLTMDEVQRIEEVLCPRDNIIFFLMLGAGLRLSEVINLKKDDMDFVNNVIYLKNCKYNKNRIVPIPDKVKYYCRHYDSRSDYVVSTKEYEQMSANTVKLMFARTKKRSGVDRVHAHLLRHTFATSYIIGGGSMEKLRIFLGHSDYSVTKNYLHLGAQFELLHYPIYRLDAELFKTGYDE